MKYCSLKKKKLNQLRESLEKKLALMVSRLINCDPISKTAVLTSINITQNDLDKLVKNNAKGAAVRSRARWMEYGKKNTKFFFGSRKTK